MCAANLVYILSIAITLFPFYGQNIKNGVIYSGVLILIFTAILLKNQLKSRSWPALIIASLVVIIFCSFAYVHIKQNNTWLSLIADAKVAFQTDEYDHWKYGGAKGYPNNERGQMVSITNYERIAWLKIGLALAPKKPWGYGLIQDSFGKLAKLSYPDSNLTHSHSGWLDILLGLGLPGFLMIMIALGLGVKNVLVLEPPWGAMGVWALMALLFLFLTTEASNKIEFDQLIFWIALVNSLWILSFVPHPAKAILS